MADGTRQLGILVLALAGAWHVLAVLSPAWVSAAREDRGRDFASYYYAVQVAAHGADPYDKRALSDAAREDGTRRGVHPFLYAPPFLLTMAWLLGTAVMSAKQATVSQPASGPSGRHQRQSTIMAATAASSWSQNQAW